jgi:hypothetical protein
VRNNPLNLLEGSTRRINVAWSKSGTQRVVAAEDVQRHVTVIPVVPVEKSSELMAMNPVVCRIQVQNNPPEWNGVLDQKTVDKEILNLTRVTDNLLVSTACRCADFCQFQPIEGTFTCQGFAPITLMEPTFTKRISLPDSDGQQGIESELVVIIEVFVSQADAEHSLLEQVEKRMFDSFLVAMVAETVGKSFKESELVIDLPQEQSTCVRCDVPTIKGGDHRTVAEVLELHGLGVTLCHSEESS